MSLGVSIVVDTGRALMAAMQPLTGGRATGLIRMRTQPGTVLEIPQYSYWCPVLDGQRATSFLFKSGKGPNSDKSWTVDDSGNSLVGVMSNIGGARHNVDKDTVFQPDIAPTELIVEGVDAPKAEDDFTNATDPPSFCGVRGMAVYETFDGPALTLDLHRSPLNQFPGVLLAFQNLEPADGVAIAQNNQAAVNAGDGIKFYKVTYSISVITTKGEGDMARRQEGLFIADTITQLLNDKHMGDVGECLSNPGGVQIRQMIREDGPQDIYKKFYIYTVLVSAMTSIVRLDFRQYNPWLRAVLNVDKPQIPSLPDQGPLRLVDGMLIDMTPAQLDLALDGTFARASGANLWDPAPIDGEAGQLLAFASGDRRITNAALGVYLEPEVTNDLGTDAEDLTAPGWTASGGATVVADDEANPLGVAASADRVNFAADVDSQLDRAGLVAGTDPVVLQVFAKAPGNKFKSEFRLAAVDAAAVEHVSDDIIVGPSWTLYRFEVVPTMAGALTFRLKNASDGVVHQVMLWGANYSDAARWGAEYPGTGTKLEDALAFATGPVAGQQSNLVTPLATLAGRWALRFRTPDDVPPDVFGTATGAPGRTLVSVGDGITELVTLRLVGTPGSGGAAFALVTRSDGVVVSLAGVEWVPGAELVFTVDATGLLRIEGTSQHDADYPFPRYLEDAVQADDFLVIGDESGGGSSPAPGRYVSVRDVER